MHGSKQQKRRSLQLFSSPFLSPTPTKSHVQHSEGVGLVKMLLVGLLCCYCCFAVLFSSSFSNGYVDATNKQNSSFVVATATTATAATSTATAAWCVLVSALFLVYHTLYTHSAARFYKSESFYWLAGLLLLLFFSTQVSTFIDIDTICIAFFAATILLLL